MNRIRKMAVKFIRNGLKSIDISIIWNSFSLKYGKTIMKDKSTYIKGKRKRVKTIGSNTGGLRPRCVTSLKMVLSQPIKHTYILRYNI